MPGVPTTTPPFPTNDPLASLPRVDRHKPKCAPVRPSKAGRKRAWVLIAVHVLVGLHIWHWAASGETLTPLEPSESIETLTQGRVNAGFLLFLALITSTLVFGRWFCGWACHVVALQDLSAWLLGKLGLRPRPVRSRLLVLAPWVVAGHMFAWPLVESWLGIRDRNLAPIPPVSAWELHLTTTELWRTFPGPLMAFGTFLVCGFLIVWWLGAKGFCTYGCPYGAFFAVADRFAPLRIRVTDACDACGHCTNVCSSNVRVHEEVAKHGQIVDPGCMKCMDCVSVCPKDALFVGFAAPKPFVASQQRIQARADFTWPEEVLLGVVAFAAAEWAWRGAWLGEGVPFLMAVGLGVITAVFALLAFRLVRRRDVQFQHTPLKVGGRFTRAGWWSAAFVAGWLVLAAHTWYGQHQRDAVFAAMKAVPVDAAKPQLEQLLARADAAGDWGLVRDPFVDEMRGLLLWRLGREQEGGDALLHSFEVRGHLDIQTSSLNLAMACLPPRSNRPALAEKVLRKLLAVSPQHELARRMLDAAVQLQK